MWRSALRLVKAIKACMSAQSPTPAGETKCTAAAGQTTENVLCNRCHTIIAVSLTLKQLAQHCLVALNILRLATGETM